MVFAVFDTLSTACVVRASHWKTTFFCVFVLEHDIYLWIQVTPLGHVRLGILDSVHRFGPEIPELLSHLYNGIVSAGALIGGIRVPFFPTTHTKIMGGGALAYEVGYHPHKKIHVIRVVCQDQAMHMLTSFRDAKTCKIGGKGVFLVMFTNFGKEMTTKLRKKHTKTCI